MQQRATFNKTAALYRLYEQIKPYADEVFMLKSVVET